MATYNKIQDFSEQLVRGIHDWDLHVFKVMLSNSAPLVSNTVKADLTEIASGNGYSAGGSVTTITIAEVTGTTTVQGSSVVITAGGGSIGPFRYVTLYNDSAASKNLIAFWDYGTNITLNDGESFTIKFNNSNPGTVFTLL